MLSLFCPLGKQKIGMVKWLAPGHPPMEEKPGFEFRSHFRALSNFLQRTPTFESQGGYLDGSVLSRVTNGKADGF